MRQTVQLLLLFACMLLVASTVQAQWQCLYATYDMTDENGTGNQVSAVGVIKENMFVALVSMLGQNSYMIPYKNADSSRGRLYTYGYGSATDGIHQVWTDGAFDEVTMQDAFDMVARPDSFLYVASNDPDHNVLVFKFINDTVTVVPVPGTGVYPRQPTGTNSIWGIAVDRNGYVYVCNDTTTGKTDDIKVYPPIGEWNSSHTTAPLKTVDLPDGIYKGITVSPDGKQLFVCDYPKRKVLKYAGSPTTGYTQATAFNFALGAADTTTCSTLLPGPIGIGYLSPNNIVFVVCDVLGFTSTTYTYCYGSIFLANPNTGARVSADSSVFLIDMAKWNYTIGGGSYTNRGDGNLFGNASMYTSPYDVKFDEKGNLYTTSYWGWTVDKWRYNGTLPTFTGVEQIGESLPESYELTQNYPNPFNPATTIELSLPISGFVTLKVYNLLGQEVMTLLDEHKEAGNYRVTFDAQDLPSGTYFYSLRSGSFSEMKKMVLLK